MRKVAEDKGVSKSTIQRGVSRALENIRKSEATVELAEDQGIDLEKVEVLKKMRQK